MVDTLLDIARKESEAVVSSVPADARQRFYFFTDLVRFFDSLNLSYASAQAQGAGPSPDFAIMEWGWNRATAHLLCPVEAPGGVRMRACDEQSLLIAREFLHRCGRVALMQRAAAMIRARMAAAERHKEGLIFRVLDYVAIQFLDLVDSERYTRLDRGIRAGDPDTRSHDWAHGEFDRFDDPRRTGFDLPGNFYFSAKDLAETWIRPDIHELMAPLVTPWDSDCGIMTRYDSRPEVDAHFLATAQQWLKPLRSEVGLHSRAVLNEVDAGVLTQVAAMIVAYHLKHIAFVELGVSRFPQINGTQSLTIVSPRIEFEHEISAVLELPRPQVSAALDVISLKASEASRLQNDSNTIAPLLIDPGNGVLLRPISGIFSNPLATIAALERLRDPNARNRIQKPREEWMRSDLYAMFGGTRYTRVEGNPRVRLDGQMRYQIGPVPNVFRDLHRALLQEHHQTLQMKGSPFTVKAAGVSVHFENLWQVNSESD